MITQLLIAQSLCVTVDMILAGDDHNNVVLSVPEAQTQLSIWSIMASDFCRLLLSRLSS